MRVALEPLLHLERQALHPAPHVGVPSRDPHPNSSRKRDHREANALMIAVASSAGAVAAMRTRMSRPSSISSTGPSVRNCSFGSAATTTSVKSRGSGPKLIPPPINLPGNHIPAPGHLANRRAQCKRLRDNQLLLFRVPPPSPLRARQHLNSAHRTVSCTSASISTCTSANTRRIISAHARRPLTDGY